MSETRWPCPVCLGVKMEKTSLGGGKGGEGGKGSVPLTLDHCARCGGMWFELGEVQRLRSERPESLWAQIPARDERHRAQCHTCRAFVDRDAPDCAACGAKTRLNCPCCDTRMLQSRQADLTLDVCKRCKGVWFDHHELEAIWEMERDRLVARERGGRVARTSAVGSEVLLETLFWAPDLVFVGAHVAGHTVAAAAEAAPTALEAVGDAAAGVFEGILEIVVGIFG